MCRALPEAVILAVVDAEVMFVSPGSRRKANPRRTALRDRELRRYAEAAGGYVAFELFGPWSSGALTGFILPMSSSNVTESLHTGQRNTSPGVGSASRLFLGRRCRPHFGQV